MIINSVYDEKFKKYGMILEGYDFSELIDVLNDRTPKPEDKVTYVGSVDFLETLPVYSELMNRGFGGLPIQIGYCNGTNSKVSRLEYHKCSELCVYADDVYLLFGSKGDIRNYKYEMDKAEVFKVPKGIGIEVFAASLHYAPCDAAVNAGYRSAVILPRGTNGDKPGINELTEEDKLLARCNKWLLEYPASIDKEHITK